ncbi:MAG TPA: glycosyltransferase family 4 protein [Acetobacteraceae bacterium]|nr:glycosyltransferase family 4 protein [Acetobacteraceae bacterium]
MLNHEFTVTGASTQFFTLAQHLVGTGHVVSVASIGPADGPMRERFASLSVPIITSVDLTSFDAAIANTICAAPAVVLVAKHIPTIWWQHETEVGLRLLMQNPTWVEAFDIAAVIIFQTDFQRDTIYRSFTYRRSVSDLPVIPYGVALPDTLARDRVAPKQRSIRVVSVGTVEPRKRHDDLIRAVSRLAPDALECVIVGKWFGLPEEVVQILQGRGQQFHLTDEVAPADAAAWIESADIFCLCSSSESFPISALEAGLLHKPLILTDLPYYRGHYEHGQNCLLYPVGDIELLAGTISVLAASEDLRARLGSAAHQLASRHTQESFFARFDALLHAVAGTRKG